MEYICVLVLIMPRMKDMPNCKIQTETDYLAVCGLWIVSEWQENYGWAWQHNRISIV